MQAKKENTMNQAILCDVLIVGSGGNGIAAAARLKLSGVADLAIVSKHDDFGGTWLQNTYPGCEVDVPAPAYQFTFAEDFEWDAFYPKQEQILEYLKGVAKEYDLYAHAHFGQEMLEATWSDAISRWTVRTDKSVFEAKYVMLATGFLEETVFPSIAGVDTFEGRIFHSSQWPEGYTGEGDRIAIIGTGSSAIQIVPEMQKVAQSVTVFQRTPTWVLPKDNHLYDEAARALMRSSAEWRAEQRQAVFVEREVLWDKVMLSSEGQEFEAAARGQLEKQVADPELRELLTPTHPIGCKRPLISDNYYPALQQPNVRLIPEAAVEIGPRSISPTDGESAEVDTIVFATGFHFGGHILSAVKRRDGRTVAEAQADHPRAYKSVSLSGCPNLFLCGGSGPNGMVWPGMFCGEVVAGYMLAAFAAMQEQQVTAFEAREDAETVWKRKADEILARGPIISGGCLNYSLDGTGHNKAMWPGNTTNYIETLSSFDTSAYVAV